MATLMIVGDQPQSRRLLEPELAAAGHRVLSAVSGEEALAPIQQEHPALIFLNVALPDMCGLELLRLLKTRPATAAIPVILLSERDDPHAVVKGLELGADWYVTHPIQAEEVSLLARRFLVEGSPATTPADDQTTVSQAGREREPRFLLHWPDPRRVAVPA
jgi:DNA-binding response OmpR family regulator